MDYNTDQFIEWAVRSHNLVEKYHLRDRHPSMSQVSINAYKTGMMPASGEAQKSWIDRDQRKLLLKAKEILPPDQQGHPWIFTDRQWDDPRHTPEVINYWKEKIGTDKPWVRGNAFGFREEQLPTEPGDFDFALGCSNTFGMGIPEDYRWSNVLERLIGRRIYNFGACGAGIMSVYRLALLWIPILRPKNVFVWAPPRHRFEMPTFADPRCLVQVSASVVQRHKRGVLDGLGVYRDDQADVVPTYYTMLENEYFTEIQEQAYLDGLNNLCREYGVNCYYHAKQKSPFKKERTNPLLCAADGHHPGPLVHEYIAEALEGQYRGSA